MSRRNAAGIEQLVKLPWQASAGLCVIAFVCLRWIIPACLAGNEMLLGIKMLSVTLAPLAAGFIALIACGSFFFGRKQRTLVDNQTSLESLCQVSWKEFELLVAEAYRRQGYEVEYSLGKGADGGVDLQLRKAGRRLLVQCKRWKTYSVGAPVVRELFGIMTSEKADEAVIITTGKFTGEAMGFAQGKPIQLVDGPALLEMVKQVQVHSSNSSLPAPARPKDETILLCPKCGAPMVLKIARRGQNAGNKFWGCKTYPDCTGTRDV